MVAFTPTLVHSFDRSLISVDVALPTPDADIDVKVDQEPVSVGFGFSADSGKVRPAWAMMMVVDK